MANQTPDSTDGRVLRARALREERKSQIMAAAHSVFAQKGYHASSVQDIISAAGIARGTFYLYFESKRALFAEVLDELLAQLRGVIRGVRLDGEESPKAQLESNLARVLTVLVDNRDMTAILLRQAMGLDEDFDRKLAEFYGHIVEIIRIALVVGMEIGLVRPVDPLVVARCILGGLKEALAAALLDTEAGLDGLSQQIVEYNLNGVLHG